jgi:hypothetical protein
MSERKELIFPVPMKWTGKLLVYLAFVKVTNDTFNYMNGANSW